MNKKIVAIAIAAVLAAPMALQAAPTVYGKMNISVEKDNGAEDKGWEMTSTDGTNSNLGVKGSEDLGNGLKAVYKVEFGLQAPGAEGTLNARNTYVGLAGGFGTVLMGKHDTPYKIAVDSVDPFANTTADQSRMYSGGERRLEKVVAYISPSFSGLTLAAAVSFAESSTVELGYGATPTTVQQAAIDKNASAVEDANNNVGSIYSLAAMYSNGPIYAGLGYEVISEDVFNAGSADYANDTTSASDAENETLTRGGASYDLGNFKLGAVYGMAENIDGVDGDDSTTASLYGIAKFGNTALKLAYAQKTEEFGMVGKKDDDTTAVTVGIDHNLSKTTKVYAIYDTHEIDSGTTGVKTVDYNTIALGLQVSF